VTGSDDRRRSASRGFRDELRRELPLWKEEGLVDERVERELTTRYALDERNVDVATAAVYTLGALLVGGGVISFVAWNWERVPDAVKLALGGSAMTAANVAGWWLWKVRGTRPKAGQALVFLGTLLFGANIGLVAQIWHISATWYGGLGAWALGATVAAWATGSVLNGVFAAYLAFVWSCGYMGDHEKGWPFFPVLAAALFLPLAWRLRSRWLFLAAATAVTASLAVAAGLETSEGAAVFAALLCAAAALVAWPLAFNAGPRTLDAGPQALDAGPQALDAGPQALGADESPGARLAPVARVLGFLVFGGVAYTLSFHEAADHLSLRELDGESFRWAAAAVPVLLCAAAFVTLGGRRSADPIATARTKSPTLAALAGVALLVVGMAAPEDTVWLTVAGNAALALTAAVAVAASVRDLERGPFWWGTLTLALLVVSRFFEYDTNLGLKALIFAGSGVGVIVVGVLFERRLKARRARDAA